jgi:hypothetical protein
LRRHRAADLWGRPEARKERSWRLSHHCLETKGQKTGASRKSRETVMDWEIWEK